jgi:hypothetical protein
MKKTTQHETYVSAFHIITFGALASRNGVKKIEQQTLLLYHIVYIIFYPTLPP